MAYEIVPFLMTL